MKHIPVDEAGPAIAPLMLADPDTVPPDTPVSYARAEFANPRHKLILIADGENYLGAISPDNVNGAADDDALGGLDLTTVPTLRLDASTETALELIETSGMTRIPVVDDAGKLHGLLCFNRTHEAFCVAPD